METLDFQTALKECIDLEGLTQSELARRSGVGQQTISKYLKGKVDQPRMSQKEKLAKALGFSTLKKMLAYGREKRTGEKTYSKGDESLHERLRHYEQRIKDLEKLVALYESTYGNP